MPDFRDHAVTVPAPGAVDGQDTLVLGSFLRDVVTLNDEQRNFRICSPDETLSNLLGAVFEVTDRQWDAATMPVLVWGLDEIYAPSGAAPGGGDLRRSGDGPPALAPSTASSLGWRTRTGG